MLYGLLKKSLHWQNNQRLAIGFLDYECVLCICHISRIIRDSSAYTKNHFDSWTTSLISLIEVTLNTSSIKEVSFSNFNLYLNIWVFLLKNGCIFVMFFSSGSWQHLRFLRRSWKWREGGLGREDWTKIFPLRPFATWSWIYH